MNGTKISISGESFVPLLTKIDECISYMEKNVSYLLVTSIKSELP